MSITVQNINKDFGHFQALSNINLDFPKGELVALLGPSGCGKTTLLRIIAGLESADSGHILLDGEDATHTHVRQRQIGFVFQHYALFKHMTVFDNIAFGLKIRPKKLRPTDEAIRKKVNSLLDLVQLGFLADRYPAQLSGGQRQRIALARALAVEPRVLLLDEPFGALDAKVRKELRRWLRHLHDELHISSVFVTHDQEEALEVADRIVVMNKGKTVQNGSPRDVFENPATPFVFDFLGQANRFTGKLQNGILHTSTGSVALPPEAKLEGGLTQNTDNVIAFARPDELTFTLEPPAKPHLAGEFLREVWLAGNTHAEVKTASGDILEIDQKSIPLDIRQLAAGQNVYVSANRLHLFAESA